MDSSPLPNSSGSSLPSRNALPVSLRLNQPGSLCASDPIAVVDVLRQALAAGERSTDSILRAATDAARALTGAHGTALALRTNGAIVCRARSGDIAPELGAPINVESGISGECLRAATILVCNDAATDTRVDLEACLALGVRSIIVVPLRGAMGMAGILEAFSTRAYAFGAEQIDSLRALAEIAETAYDREGRSQTPGPASAASRPSLFARPVSVQQIPASKFSDEHSPKRRYWIPAVVVVALLLVSTVVWLSWREPAEIAASESVARALSATEESSGRPAPRVLPLKPDPGVAGRQSDRLRTKNVLQNAAEIESAASGPGLSNSAPDQSDLSSAVNPTLRSAPPSLASEPPPPSIEVATSTIPDQLDGLNSVPAALPAFGASVSTGVTEGSLIHKVDPTYPPEARNQRLAGPVVLDASIAEDGSIHEVKVVSGSPLLAAAATAAVRQWRYRPYRLSGKPIAVQKRITIVFTHP
jgi:TonB family protein